MWIMQEKESEREWEKRVMQGTNSVQRLKWWTTRINANWACSLIWTRGNGKKKVLNKWLLGYHQ